MSLMYNMWAKPARPALQRKLPAPRHEGPEWDRAVKRLRSATKDAVSKACWRTDCTPDSVGVPIIEHLSELHPGALHVLSLVAGILIKASRR